MLSETLATGLEHYKIGPKIRALRLKKKLGLVQLGEHTGLSPGMLSKIERGALFPTLPTLLRIALVFGFGLEHCTNGLQRVGHPPALCQSDGGDKARLHITGINLERFSRLDQGLRNSPCPQKLAQRCAHRHCRSVASRATASATQIGAVTGQASGTVDLPERSRREPFGE